MNKITLDDLHIENFKGIRELDVVFGDAETDIYGDNATGKTSVFDSIMWLVFGKDSRNQTVFGIKPLNTDGEVANHGTVTSATLNLTVRTDDEAARTYELRKEYSEKWTKRRGSSNAVFSGHTTTYFIDGVPKTQTEYSEVVSGLIDQETFRQLTNPLYVAETLDWKQRRTALLDMVGDVSMEDVLAANPALESVRDLLLDHSPSDALKKLKSDRTRLNKRRAELPVRIDEATKSMGYLKPVDLTAEQSALDRLEKEIASEQVRIEQLKAGGHVAEITELAEEILRLREEAQAAVRAEMDAYREQCGAYDAAKRDMESHQFDLSLNKASLEARVRQTEEQVEGLRDAYRTLAVEQWEGYKVCPTCGQDIPPETIEERIEAFNMHKSHELEEMAQTGKNLNAQIGDLKAQIATVDEHMRDVEAKLAALVRPTQPESRHGDTPEIAALVEQRRQLEIGDEAARIPEINKAKLKIAELKKQAEEHAGHISAARAAKAASQRIEKLSVEEHQLAAEIEKTDAWINACEEFTRTKVDLMEDRINSLFHLAKWRLFRTQINGGLEECCDLTVDGVPWQDLNSAMRINAGIDVINTLSEHYGVSAPVFIDNAESVTQLEPTDGQRIRLVVSEQDKTLRVENGMQDGAATVCDVA